MRYRVFVPAFIAVLVLSTTLAEANPWSFESWKARESASSWEGFGVGSMVHKRSVSEFGPHKQVVETKTTVMKVTDTEIHLRHETKMGDTWQTSEEVQKRKNDLRIQVESRELGTDSVEVEGTSYPCRKLSVTLVFSGLRLPMTIWEHEKEGILKIEGTQEGVVTTTVVTRLSVPHDVGGTSVKCREMKISSSMNRGTQLLSTEVPGQAVLHEMSMQMGTQTTKNDTRVLAFVKK